MGDKVQIFGSPLGMYSMLRDDFIISVINDNGQLDEVRLTAMVKFIANMGANSLRDFYWIDSKDAFEKISPFREDQGGVFNDAFFQNQRKIAEICQQCGIRYYMCLFDECGTKKNVGDWNPWRFFNDFFYGEDAKERRHQYMEKVLAAMAGLDFGLEVCNEPRHGQGKFLADTFIFLTRKKMDPNKIILGNDYYLKEKGGKFGSDYRAFRDTVAKELGDRLWKRKIKTHSISPVHNATVERIDDLWGPNVRSGGDRRILYSMDGVRKPGRPDKNLMHQIATKVLKKKSKARERDKVLFEVVFGKQEQNPIDSLTGVSRAYGEIFGKPPANKGKFPDAKYPVPFSTGSGPGPEPKPEPVPEPEPGKTLQQQINDLRAQVEQNKREIAELKKKLG